MPVCYTSQVPGWVSPWVIHLSGIRVGIPVWERGYIQQGVPTRVWEAYIQQGVPTRVWESVPGYIPPGYGRGYQAIYHPGIWGGVHTRVYPYLHTLGIPHFSHAGSSSSAVIGVCHRCGERALGSEGEYPLGGRLSWGLKTLILLRLVGPGAQSYSAFPVNNGITIG